MVTYEQQQQQNVQALGALIAPTLTSELNFFRGLQAIADDFFAITGEVFVRNRMGSDVVSGPRIFGGMIAIGVIGALAGMAGVLTPWFIAYGAVFPLLALIHRLRCGIDGLSGPHTEFMGYSWLCYLKPDLHSWRWTFYTWGEPALLALLGAGLCFLDPVLGVWIIIVASSMRRQSGLMYKWEKNLRKRLKNAGITFEYWLGQSGVRHPGVAQQPTMAGRVR